jgi:hypothetical protein
MAFCAKLGRKGLARRPDEGPLDYTARVAAALPARAAAVQAISDLYAELRYGRQATRENIERLKREVGAFKP